MRDTNKDMLNRLESLFLSKGFEKEYFNSNPEYASSEAIYSYDGIQMKLIVDRGIGRIEISSEYMAITRWFDLNLIAYMLGHSETWGAISLEDAADILMRYLKEIHSVFSAEKVAQSVEELLSLEKQRSRSMFPKLRRKE